MSRDLVAGRGLAAALGRAVNGCRSWQPSDICQEVLRQYEHADSNTAALVLQEAATLRAVHDAGLPAPEPIAADPDSRETDAHPAIALSCGVAGSRDCVGDDALIRLCDVSTLAACGSGYRSIASATSASVRVCARRSTPRTSRTAQDQRVEYDDTEHWFYLSGAGPSNWLKVVEPRAKRRSERSWPPRSFNHLSSLPTDATAADNSCAGAEEVRHRCRRCRTPGPVPRPVNTGEEAQRLRGIA